MVTNRYIGGGNDQVGTIIQYFGSNPPKGFLSCDGSIYNIVDYSRLANHIEVEFGRKNFFGGDGTTTFAVPDLRGEFLRGTGTNGATEISGSNVGYHQDGTEIPYNSNNTSSFWTQRKNNHGEISNTDKLIAPNSSADIKGGYINYSGEFIPGSNAPEFYTSRPTNTSVLYCIRW